MGQMSCRVHIRKDAFKFSSAHMTVFHDGTKESLHGHNYTTDITIELKEASVGELISFSEYKKSIREICSEWDEKVLLPRNCPYLEVRSETEYEVEFFLCHKRYVLPQEEVVFLSVDNITSESLAREFNLRLQNSFKKWIDSKYIL